MKRYADYQQGISVIRQSLFDHYAIDATLDECEDLWVAWSAAPGNCAGWLDTGDTPSKLTAQCALYALVVEGDDDLLSTDEKAEIADAIGISYERPPPLTREELAKASRWMSEICGPVIKEAAEEEHPMIRRLAAEMLLDPEEEEK